MITRIKYNPKEIEGKWQKLWEAEEIYHAPDNSPKPKFYNLVMLPYPSGNLHMGHWYNFAPADAYGRFIRMQSYNVMQPMGFDAFGLPAENAAISHGVQARTWTLANINTMRKQLRMMGAQWDWQREIISCMPDYYKWTQWLFLQFYKQGLAYRTKAPANWCPGCNTTLANEQVLPNGTCERCGSVVIRKEIDQWLLKITDYVLMGYGAGAIMGVPGHDQRDFEFARKFGIPIREVIRPEDEEPSDPDTWTEAKEHLGVMVNSGPFDGTRADEAIDKVTRYLEEKGIGKFMVTYRLRDWLISRQRYWGAPFPIVYCPTDGTVPVPEEQLPVRLPEHVEFKPTGESPLRYEPEFLNTTCPICGGPATRETDTMDTFMDSSWYFLRYADPHNDKQPWSEEAMKRWLPVDQYIGGE